jgi:hypothetical protein
LDRSAVKAIVDRESGPLMRRLGISHWKIKFDYDLCERHDDRRTEAECTRLVDYNDATVSFDPAAIDDEDHCLDVLRHELFHVVLAPIDIFSNAIRPIVEGDDKVQGVLESVKNHAVEQAVIALQRMYRGLTSTPGPDTTDDAPPGATG